MKKLVLLLFLFSTLLISCNKSEKETSKLKDNLTYIETIPGGCALGYESKESSLLIEPDTVIYDINEDSLSIYVGFNAECGPDHSTNAKISNDTIYMFINRNNGPYANCGCYFIYDFHFSGLTKQYY